jgi:hypothetical protein
MTEERVEYVVGNEKSKLNQLEQLQVDNINLKFLIGGLIEYISESTDFWDWHGDIEDVFPLVVDWAKKIESGLHEAPMPPKTPCTCPNEWAKSRMESVKRLLESIGI